MSSKLTAAHPPLSVLAALKVVALAGGSEIVVAFNLRSKQEGQMLREPVVPFGTVKDICEQL